MAIAPKPSSTHTNSPCSARPQCRTGLGSAAPHGLCLHTARRARPEARSEHVPWHGSRRLIGGYPMGKLCTEVDPSDGALNGMVWPEAEVMDRPCRGPHLARSVALPAMVGDWMTRRKVSTGHIHGPQRTCLTRSKALDCSGEGGRWRCGTHRRGRRR
jgi:hypothetical protein